MNTLQKVAADKINEELKFMGTNTEREEIIGAIIDGICIHCGEVEDGRPCPCRNDE